MAIPTVRLLAIGDIAWDILVRPAGEFVWGSDVYGSVDLLPGGSSANVAVWAHRLGARATLIGKIGDDRLGDLMQAHLETEQVAAGVTRVAGRPTDANRDRHPAGRRARLRDGPHPAAAADGRATFRSRCWTKPTWCFSTATRSSWREARRSRRRSSTKRGAAGYPWRSILRRSHWCRRYGGAQLLRELGPLDVLLANEEELGALAENGRRESLLAASPAGGGQAGRAGRERLATRRERRRPGTPVGTRSPGGRGRYDRGRRRLRRRVPGGLLHARRPAGRPRGREPAGRTRRQPSGRAGALKNDD